MKIFNISKKKVIFTFTPLHNFTLWVRHVYTLLSRVTVKYCGSMSKNRMVQYEINQRDY